MKSGKEKAMKLPIPVFLAALSLAACGTTQTTIPYAPATQPVRAAQAAPVVSIGRVTDARPNAEGSARNWVGTIRGGFGNPLKQLDTTAPVADVVRDAFRDGLAARGLLAAPDSSARHALDVTVEQFNANQMIQRAAEARFAVTLTDPRTGAVRWRGAGTGAANSTTAGSVLVGSGVFASVEELRLTAQRAMSDAVDNALDAPGFQQAVR
jgi:hypothetical protein